MFSICLVGMVGIAVYTNTRLDAAEKRIAAATGSEDFAAGLRTMFDTAIFSILVVLGLLLLVLENDIKRICS